MSCHHEHKEHGGDDHDHHDHSHEPEDPEGDSLLPFVDTSKVRCLNEETPEMCKSVFKPFRERLSTDKVSQMPSVLPSPLGRIS